MPRNRQRRRRDKKRQGDSNNGNKSDNAGGGVDKKSDQNRIEELLEDEILFDEIELQEIVARNPRTCAVRYHWYTHEHVHHAFPLWRVCLFDPSTDLLQMMYDAYPQAIWKADEFMEQTPLHAACENSAPDEVIHFLVSKHPDSLRKRDHCGYLPLHLALFNDASLEMIKYLVSKYPYCLKGRDRVAGSLPLHQACDATATYELIEFLVSQYPESVKDRDRNGCLPLHHACGRGAPVDVISFLVSQYPNSIKERDQGGFLPLHGVLNCRSSPGVVPSPGVIPFLLTKYPDAARERDDTNRLPLHLACNNKDPVEVISMLLTLHPIAAKEKDSSGILPLHLACMYEQYEEPFPVLCMLISANREATKEVDGAGHLPLHWAFCGTEVSQEAVRYLVCEYPDALQHKDSNGRLPLHWAYNQEAPLETICALISANPKDFDPSSANPTWRMIREDSRAFVLATNDELDGQIFATFCDNDTAAARIADKLQDIHIRYVIVLGGGMQSHMLQPLASELQNNDILLYLGLSGSPIGDIGAEMLALTLKTNRTLRMLDLKGCGIGVDGLSSMLEALEGNDELTDLDLSHNPSIFNQHGGVVVATNLSLSTELQRFYLFCEQGSFSQDYELFLSELIPLLQWSPRNFSPILVNNLTQCMVQAIYYYQQELHEWVLASIPLWSRTWRKTLWHYIMVQSNIESQNNADVIFFYVKEMLDY